jgi:tRNA(Arg) A34 adenosine deaminase TadA
MANLPASLCYSVPAWLAAWSRFLPQALPDDAAAMAIAIEAASLNVREGTGGPFGALVVDTPSGRPLAVAVNLVVTAHASALHAEIVALLLAQQAARTHDLSLGGTRHATLYTSAEPCAMCMGAIPWSGIRRVVVAARDEDVRAIGFDEGDKPVDWIAAYSRRGIDVTQDVLRCEAVRVLRDYAAHGGALY